jgi:hypothetical protein
MSGFNNYTFLYLSVTVSLNAFYGLDESPRSLSVYPTNSMQPSTLRNLCVQVLTFFCRILGFTSPICFRASGNENSAMLDTKQHRSPNLCSVPTAGVQYIVSIIHIQAEVPFLQSAQGCFPCQYQYHTSKSFNKGIIFKLRNYSLLM